MLVVWVMVEGVALAMVVLAMVVFVKGLVLQIVTVHLPGAEPV